MGTKHLDLCWDDFLGIGNFKEPVVQKTAQPKSATPFYRRTRLVKTYNPQRRTRQSHPAIGAARFGPNVSGRLNSSSEELITRCSDTFHEKIRLC